jgi:hypothetical protein
VAITDVHPGKLLLGASRHVQGVASTIDDILLRGKSFRAEISDAVIERPKLTRTIEGSSTLSLPIEDADRVIRQSRLLKAEYFDVEIDDLWFRLAGCNASGPTLTLTFEDRIISWLRTGKGNPRKATRGKVTRAEFCVSQVLEVPQRIPIFCPELHVVQPIETGSDGRAAASQVDKQHGKGLDKDAKLTVKGEPATPSQIDVGDRILRVAESVKAPRQAVIALMAAAIVESLLLDYSSNLLEVIPSTAAQAGIGTGPDAAEAQARSFLVDGYAVGKSAGAIAVSQRDSNPAHIAQAVQNSGAGASTNGEGNYGPWVNEATEWVDAFQGGTISGGSSSVEIDKPYQFERKQNETRWVSISRLLDEVRWRHFVAGDTLNLIAEDELLKARVRARLKYGAPGIDTLDWDRFTNKRVQEVTVTGRMKDFAAPPGTVAVVSGEGPADARYLVSQVETYLGSEQGTLTCKRRTLPRPEPAPETKTKTIDLGHGSSRAGIGGGTGADLAKWATSKLGIQEGSAVQLEWSQDLGYSADTPWCSIFVATGVKEVYGLNPPANAAYSGDWETWGHDRRVSLKGIQPGDLVIFDWGDGGMTDHIAIYVGGGQVIGGNQSNAVTKTALTTSAVVAVMRLDV